MSVVARFKKLWDLTKESEPETVVAMNFDLEDDEPFLSFPCPECEEKIVLDHTLSPGQVAVMKCGNCGEVWTVYLPPVEIKPVKEMEEVWPFLADDPFEEEPADEFAEIGATP